MRVEFRAVRDLKRSPRVWEDYLMNSVTDRIFGKKGENKPRMGHTDWNISMKAFVWYMSVHSMYVSSVAYEGTLMTVTRRTGDFFTPFLVLFHTFYILTTYLLKISYNIIFPYLFPRSNVSFINRFTNEISYECLILLQLCARLS